MRDITILYYSANNQPDGFEDIVVENIKKYAKDLPIVSVTHKPLDLGKNICVGEHDACYNNLFRQVQIGLREITTKYVLTCESDFLYPEEYFDINPDGKEIYRYDNVWVVFPMKNNNKFHYKGFSDGAQCIDREMWLTDIEFELGKDIKWYKKDEPLKVKARYKNNSNVWTGKPAITFKTEPNVRKNTKCMRIVKRNVEFWGNIEELKKRMRLK